MKKYIFLIILASLISLPACQDTPDEQAVKAVREYIADLQQQGDNHTFTIGGIIDMQDPTEGYNINLKPYCHIYIDGDVKVESVRDLANHPDYKVVSVRIGDRLVNFYAKSDNSTSKPYYIIEETRGLYDYDLNKVGEKFGCEVLFQTTAKNDNEKMEKVISLIWTLEEFNRFANAVSAKDSLTIYKYFPNLNKYNFSFKEKPIANSIDFENGKYKITCNDSTAYIIDYKIEDCLGIISVENIENEVRELEGEPNSRNNKFDIAYIKDLQNQIKTLAEEKARRLAEIEQEKARKERANKYIKQGVALVSSRFSFGTNGAKGVAFTALNTSNKTAKYVILEVVGYNVVDDPVWSDGYLQRCRGIGPIGPGETGSWSFDNIWEQGKIVHSYEIKALVIQYKDGTSKRVKLPQPLPGNWSDWLY